MATKKGGKATATEEKKEKREKKVHEPGQRPNSKQVDAFPIENGTVQTFGYPIRKMGTLTVSVVYDSKNNPVAAASTFIPGVKVKTKKAHGMIQPGVSGEGKEKKEKKEKK